MKNIIILDNKPYIRTRVKELVKESDVKVHEASNSIQLFNILSNNTYKFELIIMEINLGNENGIEVINKLKKRKINIPIIILTSEARKKMFAKGIRAGAVDYILKPFEGDFLLKRIIGDIEKNNKDSKKTNEAIEPIKDIKKDIKKDVKKDINTKNINQDILEFNNHLDKQLEKAKKEEKKYALLMITMFKFVEKFTQKVEKEYIELSKDIYPKLNDILIGADLFTVYEGQSFVATFKFSNEENETIICERIKGFFKDLKNKDNRYKEYYLECDFANYPQDGENKEELLLNVNNKIVEKINKIKAMEKK